MLTVRQLNRIAVYFANFQVMKKVKKAKTRPKKPKSGQNSQNQTKNEEKDLRAIFCWPFSPIYPQEMNNYWTLVSRSVEVS